jgi:hypothetical protein
MMWVSLTESERNEIKFKHYARTETLIQAIEDKLKEKNEKNCTGHRDEHGSRYDPFVRNSGH